MLHTNTVANLNGAADTFERIPVQVYADSITASKAVAEQIAAVIKQFEQTGRTCVLGLATGATPITMYQQLVKLHKQQGLSFRHVVTFNLDEYYPLDRDAYQSYHSFMHRHLFDHIDIDPRNIHIPDAELDKELVKQHCLAYEQQIEEAGGIDLQILGIGMNGHIGFNEPGSSIHSRTRLVALDNSTRIANSGDFRNIAEVPRLAITMGIQTIMKSRKIILMAWGGRKASIVARAAEGDISEHVPASLLQLHNDCSFVIDEAASHELTRVKWPWLTGDVDWTPQMIKRAVVNLALTLNKPVLSLTSYDYNDNGLGELLVERGDAYNVNLQVFYMLRDTITGWPGGKPNAMTPNHPERNEPYPKTCLIFSPHPDDDIISMGGTFIRLHEQGHKVHVAYQTSGNIAVTDEFVTRSLDFVRGYEQMYGVGDEKSDGVQAEVRGFLQRKKKDQVDDAKVRDLKGLIRRGEAIATCRYVGLPEEHCHFLNLPFYETGRAEKKPLGEEDIAITMELLQQLRPHQVYCAGDLADPHGTHKICLDIVMESIRRLAKEDEFWMNDCYVWLYKGAWQEWNIEEIEMAIPMSPDQVVQKRHGIFIHQSQKDLVPFQGNDSREFWQRAEERNANTAELYAKLGMPRYAAMEAFVRWRDVVSG